MPDTSSPAFQLRCIDPGAPAPVLAGVRLTGRLDAVLLEQTLQQRYRNESKQLLEVVYTFPLPPAAVLLGFASTLDGRRLEGAVVARAQAEARYEEALEAGDAPVMLEALPGGLYTANIGNLKPGEELEIELRFAELLPFEQGRLRIAIPTTIAPRYGSATRAGLQPQQVPESRLDVEYPLECELTIGASLAGAAVECPSHTARLDERGRERRLRIGGPAFLDRDLVVLVTPHEPRPSLLISGTDPHAAKAPRVRLAALQPPLVETPAPLALKLLVDCSGSMQGAGIVSARAALRGLVAGLQDGDRVALSRFGDSVEHLVAPGAFGAPLQPRLAEAVDSLQADLGGTEMHAALRAVFDLPMAAADVLMFTDGEVWEVETLVRDAQAAGQRVFVVGVGHSPAEALLRRLAASTGGACEFATPGEALAEAAQRMLRRMRQPRRMGMVLDWGPVAPAWQTRLPAGVFDGDTVFVLAGFAQASAGDGVRLLEAGGAELARAEAQAGITSDTLARLAAARRWAEGGQDAAFAVRYQLLTEVTNCVLVHERAAAEKAGEAAQLHRVASMGLLGAAPGRSMETRLDAAPMRAMLAAPREWVMRQSDDIKFCAIDTPEPETLSALVTRTAAAFAAGATSDEVAQQLRGREQHAALLRALDEVQALGHDPATALFLLLRWIMLRPGAPLEMDLDLRQLQALATLPAERAEAARAVFELRLGGYPLDAWTITARDRRALRLKGALS